MLDTLGSELDIQISVEHELADSIHTKNTEPRYETSFWRELRLNLTGLS